jgi:hypothetical protein
MSALGYIPAHSKGWQGGMSQFTCGRLGVAPAARARRSSWALFWPDCDWLAALLILVAAAFFAPRAHAEVTTVNPCILESSKIEPCYATGEEEARVSM